MNNSNSNFLHKSKTIMLMFVVTTLHLFGLATAGPNDDKFGRENGSGRYDHHHHRGRDGDNNDFDGAVNPNSSNGNTNLAANDDANRWDRSTLIIMSALVLVAVMLALFLSYRCCCAAKSSFSNDNNRNHRPHRRDDETVAEDVDSKDLGNNDTDTDAETITGVQVRRVPEDKKKHKISKKWTTKNIEKRAKTTANKEGTQEQV